MDRKRPESKKAAHCCAAFSLKSGRGERIRTSGLYVPNVALYQAKLHPEEGASIRLLGPRMSGEPAVAAGAEKRRLRRLQRSREIE